MRDTSLDLNSFFDQFYTVNEKYSMKISQKYSLGKLQMANQEFEGVEFKSNTWRDLFSLECLMWTLYNSNDVLYYELRVLLENKVKMMKFIDLEISLRSVSHFHLLLANTTKFHSRDIFGNILSDKNMSRIIRLFKIKRKPRNSVKRKIRHRGYRDKGTLKFSHEYHSFYDGTEEQREIELERQSYQDTLALLEAFIT